MDKEQLIKVLDEKAENRKFLFIRGFLVSNKEVEGTDSFPFYGTWNHQERQGFHFYTHPLTGNFFAPTKNGEIFLLGHAYNPFTMEHDENACLTKIASRYGEEDFFDAVSELTGIFVLGYIENGKLEVLVDPAGIQSACHGIVNDTYYLSSHPQLVGDVCGLEMDALVKEIMDYKYYPRVMGSYLPADLTAFAEIKRIVPNIYYAFENGEITHKRFYPIEDLAECKTEEEYQQVIEQAADIMKNNMTLITRKWKKPYISLTGGIDSNTTFAAANGNYDKFQTFSYCSAEKETIDCEAAKKIAEHFNIPWTLYQIPDNSDELKDYDEKVAIIRHNNGYIKGRGEKGNELRKRIYLQENLPCDVEVKSWVSETIRGYWYKHYGRKRMPKLSAKLYRNLYKMFIGKRKLAHKIDKLFEKYIEDFEYANIPAQYPTADIHYNEVTWGSWGSLNISEMKFYTDITIAYNNRKFLDLLFKIPLEDRISDAHHLAMKKYLNKELFDMNVRVVNMHETNFRAFCLNLIFSINMMLP